MWPQIISIHQAELTRNSSSKPRVKRIVPLIVAGIGSLVGTATAGTAFGIVTKNSLETLAQKIGDLQLQNEQILRVF